MAGICASLKWSWPVQGIHRVAAPFTRGSLLLLSQWSSSHSSNMVGHTALGAWQGVPYSLHFLYGEEGSSFPGLAPPNNMVTEFVWAFNLVTLVWWLGYQVDENTHTWSVEWFVAHSHIYTRFTGEVSSLNHFLLEPGCENYSFSDQAVAAFEQGLDSILTDSIETPELVILWWAQCHYFFSLFRVPTLSYYCFWYSKTTVFSWHKIV